MEQKIQKLKNGKLNYSLRFYRYWIAEKLHKLVNYITWTHKTTMGHTYMFSKEDLDFIREDAQMTGLTYEEREKAFIEQWHKQMIDSLLKQLEMDGYLKKTVEHNSDGSIVIGFRFDMIALKAQQIFNDDNAITFGQ